MKLWWLRLIRYARPSPRTLALILMMIVLTAAIDALKPWPLKWVVDHVLKNWDSHVPPRWEQALPGAQTRLGLTAWLAAATIVIFLLGQLLRTAQAYVQNGFGSRAVYALAGRLFDHLQALSVLFHTRQASADLVRRVTTDSGCARDVLVAVVFPIVGSLTSLLFMFTVMWRMDWMLTLIALLVVVPLGVVMHFSYAPMARRASAEQQAQSELMTLAERTLSSIPTVQMFNRQLQGEKEFQAASVRAVDAYIANILFHLRFKISTGALTALGTAGVMFIGARHVLDGSLTLGGLLVFLAYLSAFYVPLEALAYVSTSLSATRANAQRVLEILDSHEQVQEKPDAVPLLRDAARGISVRFENVTFGYDSDRPVLHEVNLDVRPGQMIAVVGPTGAGKTTLLSLLPRLFDPSQGRVLLAGHDLRDWKLNDLRDAVAVVPQEPLLLPLSIADNIAYGRPDATTQQIQHAAEAACASEFIEKLPQGYQTVIGERGCTLSAGQRQRLAIARALLRDASVLVLDEPTSALDSQSEQSVMDGLKRLCADRTCFVIAHRLSTVKEADVVVVLEAGRIKEVSSPQQLAESGGLYQQFLELQGQASCR
jgi:ATP-binding cassette subfamily B protein/subfamily B ATP-binding cassette protein MsbA